MTCSHFKSILTSFCDKMLSFLTKYTPFWFTFSSAVLKPLISNAENSLNNQILLRRTPCYSLVPPQEEDQLVTGTRNLFTLVRNSFGLVTGRCDIIFDEQAVTCPGGCQLFRCRAPLAGTTSFPNITHYGF